VIVIDGKEIPQTLRELVIPYRTAHIIIDLQNDCCHPDGVLAKAGGDVSTYPEVITVAGRLVEETRRLGVLQVFVKLCCLPGGLSDSPAWIWLRQRLLNQYGTGTADDQAATGICHKGSWGAGLVEGLEVVAGDLVVEKHRSSAFFGTDLDMLLRSNGIQTLVFSGVTTEGCVESTVRDAGFLDYFAIVTSDAVGSDVPALHEASLKVMDAYRAQLATSTEIMAAMGSYVGVRAKSTG